MSEKIYYLYSSIEQKDEEGFVYGPVWHIAEKGGVVDVGGEFAYCQGRGGWRWVHLATGAYSAAKYKTIGGCKRAVGKCRHKLLFGDRVGIYRKRYWRESCEAYRKLVEREDPGYFERLGIPCGIPKWKPTPPREGEVYYWQTM